MLAKLEHLQWRRDGLTATWKEMKGDQEVRLTAARRLLTMGVTTGSEEKGEERTTQRDKASRHAWSEKLESRNSAPLRLRSRRG